MATDFLLNCFVLGDKEDNVFTVEIPQKRQHPQEIDQGGKGPSPQSRRCLGPRALGGFLSYHYLCPASLVYPTSNKSRIISLFLSSQTLFLESN